MMMTLTPWQRQWMGGGAVMLALVLVAGLQSGFGLLGMGPWPYQMALCISAIALLIVTRAECYSIGRAALVLRQHLTPQHLWRKWLGQCLLRLCALWFVLAVALSSPQLAAHSAWQFPAAAALLSLVVCVAALSYFADTGLLGTGRASKLQSAAGVVGALMGVALARFQLGPLLDAFGALPTPALLLMALSWPAFAYLLWSRWQKLPATARRDAGIENRFLRACSKHLRRYTNVLSIASRTDTNTALPPVKIGYLLLNFCFTAYVSIFLVGKLFFVPWGAGVNSGHIGAVLSLGLLCISGLTVRDMHWRGLLAPGGLHRGRLASHVFWSTMSLNAICLGVLLVLTVLASLVLRGPHDTAFMELALERAVILPEIMLATAFAVLLRALFDHVLIAFVLIGLPLRYVVEDILTRREAHDATVLFQLNWTYVGGLLLATALCLMVANRLLTMQSLMRTKTRKPWA